MSMKKQFRKLTAICMAAIMSLESGSVSLTAFADQSVDLEDLNPENIFEDTAIKATPSDAEKRQENEYEIATGSNADISDEKKNDRKNESKYDKNDKIDTTKIYDFIWQDPEEYLNDGRLELSATAEEQPTLEQIVSILPQSIRAKTKETAENTSADESEDITADVSEDITADYDAEIEVSGWQCADYIQNEDGMWPTSGIFTFSAEPEDGYELADGCAPLAVEVTVSDEAAMLATNTETYMVFARRKDNTSVDTATVDWDGENLSGDYAEFLDGSSKIYREGDAFVLELNNYNPERKTTLEIREGTWIVRIYGNNYFDGTNLPIGIENTGLIIWNGADVSFQGSGNLRVKGVDEGIVLYQGANVSVKLDDGGKITALSDSRTASDNTTKRYGIYSLGTLNIESGSVITTGADYGLYQNEGNFRMAGGVLTAKGYGDNHSQYCVLNEVPDFSIAGEINAFTAIWGSTGSVTSGSIAELGFVRIENPGSSLTINEGASLKINTELVLDKGGKLINNGTFQTDLIKKTNNYTNNGTVLGANAESWKTLSNLKQTGNTSESSRKLIAKDTSINVTELFNAGEIMETEGTVTYYYRTGKDAAENEISSGKVTFTQDGKYELVAKTSGNGKYQRGTAIVYILVNSVSYYVDPIPFVYTGSWQSIFKVYGLEEGDQVEYLKHIEEYYGNGRWEPDGTWEQGIPGGINVHDDVDSDDVNLIANLDLIRYKIRVLKEGNQVYISDLLENPTAEGKSIDSEDVSAKQSWESIPFDGNDHKPVITLTDTARNKELQQTGTYPDYKVSYQRDGEAVSECKEAGNYTAVIEGENNYKGSRTIAFTIESPKLTPEITINNSSKPYDGTKTLASNQKITLKWKNEQNQDVTSSIINSSYHAEYRTENVTNDNAIIVTVALSEEDSKKYSLTETSLSIPGSITKAAADKLQHSVVLDHATVDYENRTSAAPVVTVKSTLTNPPTEVYGYTITYSYGNIQNATSLSEILEKLNAQDTPYTIHYQIVTDNYDTTSGTFQVTIQKSSMENKGIVVTGYNGVYDGNPHTISTTLPESVPKGTKIEYKGSGESEWNQDPPSYTNAGEYTVDYKVSCPNYEDLEGNQTVHISPKALTVSASPNNAQITYGDECPEFTPVYKGFVDGENEDNSDLKVNPDSVLKIKCAYQKDDNAGEYPITLSGLRSNNYEITYTLGKLTVGKKEPEISTKDAKLWRETIYSGNPVDLGIQADGDGEKKVTITNLDTGESNNYPLVKVSYPSHAGHYKAILTVSEGTNYQAKAETYEFEIQKKELKITADDKTVIVGNQAPEFTISYEGFVDGEDQSVLTGAPAFTCSYDMDTSEVGTYPILLSVDGVTAADYSLVPENGTLTVTDKLIPTITTADPSTWRSRVYDGTTTDLKASADGDGVLTVTVKDAEGNILNGFPKHAGSYTAILSYAEGQTYAAKEEEYSFEILPAPLTITAEDKRVTMGDVAPEYTAVYDGFVNGEDASVLTGTLSFTCDYTSEKTEQKYVITPSGLTGNDYVITWINGTLKAARRYSSSSDNDSDDRDDSGSSGNKGTENKGTQNTNSQAKKENITTDSQRGQVSDTRGVLTGSIITKSDLVKGGTPKDGLSHWVNDNGRYQLLYKDGTYAKAAAGGKGAGAGTSGNDAVGIAYEWILVNGNWWVFDQNGYAVTGWIRDNAYGGWFYIDPQSGMKRGWIFVNGKWYYLNAEADGKGGIMLANCLTPDGYYLKEDGSWDGTDSR